MTYPIELPSGKLLDLDRFVALMPNDNSQQIEYQLILEGYPLPINLQEKDIVILKEKLNKNLPENKEIINNWNQENQIIKNQPLMNLIKQWLDKKNNLVSTPEDEEEYQNIQKALLVNKTIIK